MGRATETRRREWWAAIADPKIRLNAGYGSLKRSFDAIGDGVRSRTDRIKI